MALLAQFSYIICVPSSAPSRSSQRSRTSIYHWKGLLNTFPTVYGRLLIFIYFYLFYYFEKVSFSDFAASVPVSGLICHILRMFTIRVCLLIITPVTIKCSISLNRSVKYLFNRILQSWNFGLFPLLFTS